MSFAEYLKEKVFRRFWFWWLIGWIPWIFSFLVNRFIVKAILWGLCLCFWMMIVLQIVWKDYLKWKERKG